MAVDLKERFESIARQCQNACDNLRQGPDAREQAIRAFQNIKFVAERAASSAPRPGAGDASGVLKEARAIIAGLDRRHYHAAGGLQQHADCIVKIDAALSALSASPAATSGDENPGLAGARIEAAAKCASVASVRISGTPVPAPAPADGEAVAWHCVGSGDGWSEDKIIRHRESAEKYAERPEQWNVRALVYATPPAARPEPAAEMVKAGAQYRYRQIGKARWTAWGGWNSNLIADPDFEHESRDIYALTPEAPGAQEETQ